MTGPAFRPERLTEAREARDLTMTSLADLVGRKPASISHYENARHEPPPEVVESLADALNVGVGYFFRPPRTHTGGPTFFRSLTAATKRSRIRADRRIDWTWDILDFLEQYLEIAPADLPEPLQQDWRTLSDADIERAAADLRTFWDLGLGPIPNLVWQLEAQGIVVVRDAIGSHHLDAHSRWCGRRPVIVLNSDKKSAVRSRFDAAHELAHIILHRSVPENEVRKSENRKEIERQANRFAGAFMLPAESFAAEVGRVSLDGLLALKPRWRMAVAAMLHRCQDLALISPRRARHLWKLRSSRGWTKREPFDDELLPEQPRMLAQAFEMIFENGLATREAVITHTGLNAADIESLAGLGEGALQGLRTRVRSLHLRQVKG